LTNTSASSTNSSRLFSQRSNSAESGESDITIQSLSSSSSISTDYPTSPTDPGTVLSDNTTSSTPTFAHTSPSEFFTGEVHELTLPAILPADYFDTTNLPLDPLLNTDRQGTFTDVLPQFEDIQ
jgi:hypothetical protein